MSIKNPRKNKKATAPADDETLANDVASFASSLGLSSAAPASGFDDSDFRKSGPLKPPKPPKNPIKDDEKTTKKNQIKPKPHPLNQIDVFATSHATTSFPLVKASLLSGNWYVDAAEVERRVFGDDSGLVSGNKGLGMDELRRVVEKKREVAARVLEQYVADYEVSRKRSGDMKLLEVTARSGTSVDKVSAYTCLVEDNPIANMKALDALLSMVTSKVGKRYAFTGFEALKELFILRLLPDRKLKSLFQRPLTSLPETKDGYSLLLFWYWEDCLKQRYERYVIALEEALKDMLPNLKHKALKIVFELLKSKSEQERRLLTALVNKLGDPERKAASGAMYQLSCLLSAHPNMKAVVIAEVDIFIFRPNIGLRAKYQAVNFLSQILLSKKGDGPKIAKRLVDIYFALFKVLISESENSKTIRKNNNMNEDKKEKGRKDLKVQNDKMKSSPESSAEMDSRLLSALLTGINRAFPFVSSDEADSIIEEQTPTLFKLVHSKNFNVGIQALMLLYQISSKNQIASDRFYRALYAKLLTPAAVSSSKPEMFLGLLVKSLKNDLSLKRVSAFAKRLLQVALQRPPQYACGCLFILSEVLKAKPPLWSTVLQNEIAEDDVEHFEDIIEDSEDLATLPNDKSAKTSSHSTSQDANKYEVDEHESDLEGEESSKVMSNYADTSNGNAQDDGSPRKGTRVPAGYDPRHREPLHCNAESSCWWELMILASHVHPSVATMARTLLSGANIVYNGDPLNDLSLTAFIDKFMEKKPKPNRKTEGSWHGGSQIAPARKIDMSNHLIGEEMLQLAEDEVPPEDVVFHRFYMNKATLSKKAKKKKKSSEDEDADDLLVDGSDGSDDEEIDEVLGSGHHPIGELEGDYDYDDLDRIANEDDDDLIGNDSDDEAVPAMMSGKKHGATVRDVDDEDGSLDIWDASGDEGSDDDIDSGSGLGGSDSDDDLPQKANIQKKQKPNKKSKASPFASLEDYEHLMDDANEKQKSKPRKKRKLSK